MVQLRATFKTTAHRRLQVAPVPAPNFLRISLRPQPTALQPPRNKLSTPQPPRPQPAPSPQPAPNHLILWGAAPGGRPQVILGGVFRNPEYNFATRTSPTHKIIKA